MFDFKELSVAYNDDPVLHNISLRIRPGEKVVVIGPSGAGKSTLLKKLYELQQQHSAFIHQDYALVAQLSAFHNVCIGRLDFNSTLYNLLNLVRPKKEELQRVQPILDRLGLADKSFTPTNHQRERRYSRTLAARCRPRARVFRPHHRSARRPDLL